MPFSIIIDGISINVYILDVRYVGYTNGHSWRDSLESPFRPITFSEEGTRQEGYKEGRKMAEVTVQAAHSDKMNDDVFSVRSETSAY